MLSYMKWSSRFFYCFKIQYPNWDLSNISRGNMTALEKQVLASVTSINNF